ncbi:MAG: UDP-N-acetylmuramoyl-L-alanine--D-glutamate ligase [Myxococcota bacterium]
MLDVSRWKVLVLGLGISGRSAANFCAARGADVVAADERAAAEIGELDAVDGAVELVVGESFPDPAAFDLVIPSPGVPAKRYRERARRVWGDVELAQRSLQVPILAVTGTNGKSTTALLADAMLRAAGFRSRVAGNVGTPALDLVGEALDIAVLEVSSFQLETTQTFRPAVAVVLNITPDHLDRHGDLAAYSAAKARIIANQDAGDVAVLNFDDPRVRAFATETKARVVPFRCSGPAPGGAWLDAGAAVITDENGATTRVSLDGMRIPGAHNRENALAALAAVVAVGAAPARAATALASFEGLAHRSQRVGRHGGTTWVDDSKATNPGAALRSLASFPGDVVWIAGGRDKGLDFGELADAAADRVRAAVLIGEAAGKIARALGDRVPVHRAASIEEAVEIAAKIAVSGDVVLLAPACASQDQFRDFAERGERFAGAVAALGGTGDRP